MLIVRQILKILNSGVGNEKSILSAAAKKLHLCYVTTFSVERHVAKGGRRLVGFLQSKTFNHFTFFTIKYDFTHQQKDQIVNETK